jgi:hypothetical protein
MTTKQTQQDINLIESWDISKVQTLRNLINRRNSSIDGKSILSLLKQRKLLLILATYTIFHSAELPCSKSPFPLNLILSPLERPFTQTH